MGGGDAAPLPTPSLPMTQQFLQIGGHLTDTQSDEGQMGGVCSLTFYHFLSIRLQPKALELEGETKK